MFTATDDWEAPGLTVVAKITDAAHSISWCPIVRNGKIDDLDFGSINLLGYDCNGPRDRASAAFLTKDERTIKPIGGAADEAAWQQTLADKCAQSSFKVYLLPAPGSEWNRSTDKKKDDYGVEPTSQPTAYFMSIPVGDEHRDVIQDVDTKVQVHLRVVERFHNLPDHRLFARQIQIAPLLFTTDWAKQNRKHTIRSSQSNVVWTR